MKHRLLSLGALALLLFSPLSLSAQDVDLDFNEKQADLMHKFAQDAFKAGFPRQARLIWLEAIKLYAPDHEEAHAALGNVRVGKSWNPDPNFVYPIQDSGKGATGQALAKRYEAMRKKLADNHRRQASTWERAGRKDKSQYHYEMLLRHIKDDAEAQKALSHQNVGDLTGTSLEQTLYERSKMIEKAVSEQSKIEYPVQKIESTHPFLEQAQVKYVTFKSEHFTLRGDVEEEALKTALVWAERTYRVMQVAFPKDAGFNPDTQTWINDWAMFQDKETYKQILKANGGLVPDLAWALEHSTARGLSNSEARLYVGGVGNDRTVNDAVVRQVAQSYSGFVSPGLREGIGHTFVGMMFNNNRLFAVDLKKQQNTTASEEDREYTSPNFDVWKDLALEMAWKMTGAVSASQLPLVSAADFTNEQRIKAWSFCDYVMRRDPTLLRDMDRLRGEGAPLRVEEAFRKDRPISIADLDKGWSDFWTGASPVIRAIRNNTPPLEAVSRDVNQWLDAFNEARKAQQSTPVAWSANYSVRCKEHVEYIKTHKLREIGDIHEQDPALEGGSHLGNMFAQMAIVEARGASGSKAKKIFEEWLHIPGYRDALLNNYVITVGIYSEGGILVMNTVSGLGTPSSKRAQGFRSYPHQNAKGIPNEIDVDTLGPELAERLEKEGHGKLKKIGYPLTLHFGRGLPGDPRSYHCRVTCRGEEFPGLIVLDNGHNRHTTAPGMVTFYPLQPLKKGEVDVVWTFEAEGSTKRVELKFTTS